MFHQILPSAKPQKMAIKTARNVIDEEGKEGPIVENIFNQLAKLNVFER